MKIAIDFDGVICDNPEINRGWDFMKLKPHKGAGDAIRRLQKGHDIWIFTARTKEEWSLIRKWCKKNDIPQLPIRNFKYNANIYLDDRAVRFTNWVDFCKLA